MLLSLGKKVTSAQHVGAPRSGVLLLLFLFFLTRRKESLLSVFGILIVIREALLKSFTN